MQTITFKQLKPLLPIYLKENLVPFLAGEPGIGKSALIKSLAQETKTKVFVLSVNQLGTREDLTGARSIKDAKTNTYRQIFFPHAIIQDTIDYANHHQAENPILFLDEINRTSPDVTSAILALITERRVGTTNLPENIRIIAAGNDQGNVNNLDQASITRMAIFHVIPDINDYFNANPDLNFYVRALLQKHPDYLVQTVSSDSENPSSPDSDDDPAAVLEDLNMSESMTQMTVPRTLTYASQFLNALSLDGQTVTEEITNSYYDPMNPTNSPLYLGLQAQLGDTKTFNELFNLITQSIDKLLDSSQTTSPASNDSIKLPRPNQKLIDSILNAHSVDELNLVTTKIGDNKTYSYHTAANSFFTLLRPENLKQLPSPELLTLYYALLAKNQTQLPKNFNRYFVVALQHNLIPNSLTRYIKDDSTTLSRGLSQIIDVLNQ